MSAALIAAALPAQAFAQAGGQPAPQTSAAANSRPAPPATTTVTTRPGGQTVVTTDNPGNLGAPPPSAQGKTYPPCTRTLQDNCQNPGEGGAAGRPRAR